MAVVITRTLDVCPGGIPVVIGIKQYASDFTLRFNLISSDNTFTMEGGTTCFIRGTKTDGKGFQVGGTRSGSMVTFAGNAQMTAAAGDCEYEVVLVHSGKELPCGTFVLRVQAAAMDESTITDPSNLAEIQNQIIESNTLEYGGTNISIDGTTLVVS